MLRISARDNPFYKQLVKLLSSSRARSEADICVLEGEHLISQYHTHVGLPDTVIAAERAVASMQPAHKHVVLADHLFDALSGLTTPTGLLGLGRVPKHDFEPTKAGLKVLALDRIQDPGNVGNLLRTAAAAGVDEVWCAPTTAFAWAPRTLRASQGMQFAIKVYENVDLMSALGAFQGEVLVAGLIQAKDYREYQAKDSWCLIMGSEGQGVAPELAGRADHTLKLPMRAGVESLNVAVAAGVLLYSINKN